MKNIYEILPNIDDRDGDIIAQERVGYLINQLLHLKARMAFDKLNVQEIEGHLSEALLASARYAIYLPHALELCDGLRTWEEYLNRHTKKA